MSSMILPSLQNQFNRYGQSIILILGSIGNVFIIILFSRRRRHSSCSIYLLYAVVMNSAFILSNLSLNIFALDYGDPTVSIPSLCKIRYYTAHAWGQIARYLTVIACVDRFILTNNNARFRFLNRPLVAQYVVGITVIFWHIISIHIPILTNVNNGVCAPTGILLFNVYHLSYLFFFV